MKLLAIGQPRESASPGEIAGRARDEMGALWRLYRGGVVRDMSPWRAGAVLVLEAATRRAAEAALASPPQAAAGLISFKLIKLHPFRGFEVLFAD